MVGAPRWFFPAFVTVVLIQGVHVIEHIIQLAQVYVFDVSDDDAFGLLGYFFKPQNTEEWLHLGFNTTYLAALFLLALPLWRLVGNGVPLWSFATFAVLGLGLETWHVVEHGVIIANVIQNSGCPCPGIGDRALGVTDTQLHFVYNALAYAGTVAAFWYVVTPAGRPPSQRRVAVAQP